MYYYYYMKQMVMKNDGNIPTNTDSIERQKMTAQ